MGVAVALLILWTGVKVVKETSDPLLGTAPAREVVDDIYRTILSYDGILGLHDLNVHMYGEGRTFASVHCEVDAHEDILASHDLVDNIERDFLKQKNIHLVIHMDPIVVDDAPTNALREQVREVLRGISPEITMHDFRVVWGKTHSNVLFDVCVPFGFRYTDAALLDEIANGIYMLGKKLCACGHGGSQLCAGAPTGFLNSGKRSCLVWFQALLQLCFVRRNKNESRFPFRPLLAGFPLRSGRILFFSF